MQVAASSIVTCTYRNKLPGYSVWN